MVSKMAIAVSLLFATSAWAQDKPDDKTPNTAASYSDETPLETLASDPAAVAVLSWPIPRLMASHPSGADKQDVVIQVRPG